MYNFYTFNLPQNGYGFASYNLKREVYMAKNAQHWEKTKGLLIITLALWAIFSMGIFLFGAEMNDSYWSFWISINLLVHLSRSLLASL